MFEDMKKTQVYWVIIALCVGLVLAFLAVVMKSETTKSKPVNRAKLVTTLKAEKTDERIIVSTFGTVRPDIEVTMKTEVSGRVIEKSPNLTSGGIVKEGEVLLRLDPRNYQNTVEQEKAQLEKASFDLHLEQGRQIVAKREWEQLSSSIKISDLSEELALRKPHLKEKEAAFAAAKSRLDKGLLDLRRTVLTSPMDAVVTLNHTEVGDYVTSQTEVANIVATKLFRVQASIPVSKLKWLAIPERDGGDERKVRVIQDLGGTQIVREGRILRLLGDLDPSGRMARVLVAVEDPLGLEQKQLFPLLLGSYVRVEFDGPILENVTVLPRKGLREENKVWVKNEEGALEVRTVEILQKREDVVYIKEGLKDGEEVVISPISIPIPGMLLESLEEVKHTHE